MEILVSQESLLSLIKVFFLISVALQLAFLIGVYGRLAFFRSQETKKNLMPVSVIIAARNEEENLEKNLPLFLGQDYSDFEVIVVNDGSWDDSIDVLRGFEKQFNRLRVVNIPVNDDYEGGKKYAITLGVKAAKNNRLVFTDADCQPFSDQWLKTMVSAATNEDSIILGYSPYKRSDGLLNKLIRFDNLTTAMNYLSLALCGVPYMGVGRNLSYSKRDFYSVGGFKSHYRLLSGDDDLMINQIAHRRNTTVCIEKDAIIETNPKETWKEYWLQKRRHLTTGHRYKLFHRLILSIEPISVLVFWTSAIVLITSGTWVEIALAAIATRVLIQFLIFSRSARWLGQQDLIIFAPVFEIAIILLTAVVHLVNATSNKVTWKT